MKQDWQGRVCAGHMTALAALEPAELAPIAATIRDAGLSVLALPGADLYLMGHGDTHNVRRDLAPVRRLAEAGVNAAVSTNNVQNPFTPWGDADLLNDPAVPHHLRPGLRMPVCAMMAARDRSQEVAMPRAAVLKRKTFFVDEQALRRARKALGVATDAEVVRLSVGRVAEMAEFWRFMRRSRRVLTRGSFESL